METKEKEIAERLEAATELLERTLSWLEERQGALTGEVERISATVEQSRRESELAEKLAVAERFAALAVVSPWRLRTVVEMGIGAVVVGLATWAGTIWATNTVVNLAKTDGAKGSMRAILQATTSGLVTFMWIVIIVGVMAALLAFVFGESALAARIRAGIKRGAAKVPVAVHHAADFIGAHVDGFRIAGYAVGVGIVFLWLSVAGLIAAVVVEAVWQVGLVLIRRGHEASLATDETGRGALTTVSTAV